MIRIHRTLADKILAVLACMASLTAIELGLGVAQAATVEEVTSFGANPGNLRMFKYVPDGLPANAPLVVALHACSLHHTSESEDAGWVQLAERFSFAVAFPEQKPYQCFNFNVAVDITRGQGEVLSIKQMVDYMKTHHLVDPARIYATGLSGGAYMTMAAVSAYPDVFAGAAPIAGGACWCDQPSTALCGTAIQKTPQQWGDLVRAQLPGYEGPWPIVSVWQGDDDLINSPGRQKPSA